MASLRKYPKLPVHIVEEHNDALPHILRALGSKHLPLHNNLLVHFDSHPDLLIPADLKASEVFDIPDMLQKLSIENWILVSAFAGHISTIVWVKPPWSHQIEDGDYHFLVGEEKGTDCIKVTCPALYFVGEMLYCKPEDLDNAKEVTLHVITAGSDVDNTMEQRLLQIIEQHKNVYVLDVDLDYFSTLNPFITMHSDVNMYQRLKKLYSFEYTQTADTHTLEQHVRRRSNQIKTLHGVFCHLQMLQDPLVIRAEVNNVCEAIQDPEQRECLTSLILDLLKKWDGREKESAVRECKGEKSGVGQCEGEKSGVRECEGEKSGVGQCEGEENGVVVCEGGKSEVKECEGEKIGEAECDGKKSKMREYKGEKSGVKEWKGEKIRLMECNGEKNGVRECMGEKSGVGEHDEEESGVDWEMIHDAGCTIDDDAHQLPHHLSSKEEIDALMDGFCSLVSRLPQPTLVTVARSSVDDYCPPHQVDGIQEALCAFLRKMYTVDCLKHYYQC